MTRSASVPLLRPIMLAGTGSDVGKSLIAAGLCRIFRQDGLNPAPFKAQNMALNSYATPDGLEIGRAQAVQAEAAGIPCHTDMNPLLLKPSGEHTSQIVLNGRPIGNRDAYSYFRDKNRDILRREVCAAFDRLSSRYNPIVMEGAGSIAEINLRDTDLVNMYMARHAGASVVLIADIDRGGVFASAYGSIMLQTPEDRCLIKGIIINKFRGDMRLFESGRKMMEDICGVPVLGVVPFATDIHLEEEDSVALDNKYSHPVEGKVNVAVVRFPHISNFTDFNVLEKTPGVNLYYAAAPDAIDGADIIILPGSKSTISDLAHMRTSGMADAVIKAYRDGKTVFGICGGYQMMGQEVNDPNSIEGNLKSLPGLDLLPIRTTLRDTKVTRQIDFRFMDSDDLCHGYEIHMGETTVEGGSPLNTLYGDIPEGCRIDDKCMGTYVHGILDNICVTRRLLEPYMQSSRSSWLFDYTAYRDSQYDALADMLRHHLDMKAIYDIMRLP